MSNYKTQKFGSGTTRRNYQKASTDLPLFNLLDIQTVQYKKFIDEAILEIFKDIYPVTSGNGKIVVDFVSHNLEMPESEELAVLDAKAKKGVYSAPLKAIFTMTRINDKGEAKVKETKPLFISNIPLMTEGGSFVINGSERVIISQLVRAPGAYFENLKAARSQSAGDSAIYKISSIIPNRGAWVEFEYKDYKLLGLAPQEIKIRFDKQKRLKAGLLFFALGMQKETILELFDNHPIIEKSVAKFTVAQQQPYEARVQIFKTTNSGDRVSERQVNESLPSLLFNSQRYDLSRTGRYKLNMNLSVVPRIAGKVIAENIKDANGKVLVKAGTLIEAKQIEKLSAAIAENNVEYSTLQIDPALLNSVQIGEEKAKFHNLAHIVKVYQESNALKMLELGQEPTILKVIGNYHNDLTTLTISDIIATFGKFINLEEGMGTYDDIDSMSNRKIKSVYELLRNQFRMGLTKIQKNLRDRISAKDTTGLEVKKVTNFKLMESTLKEFFNSSQLSQFMDQINPLAEISNKRRITSLGPGGLSRDTASLVVRGIHDTHYGRIDPIETPEGPNIGLILNLALYARINEYGIIETPYFKVKNSKIQKSNPIFLTSDEESIYTIASGVVKTDAAGNITDKEVTARRNTKFVSVSPEEVNLIDVSPKQMVSIASAHIPFLENDDANRALMGANMQRQAVPLIKPDSPIVGTGIEQESAKATTSSVKAKSDGTVVSVEGATIVVKHGTRLHTYNLSKFLRSNQESAITQRPIVKEGQKVKEGEIIADGPSVDNGELAIGKNVVVAFTTWKGYNYEDAIIVSERLVKDDVYTSIHIEELVVDQRATRLGDEIITREVPNASKEAMRNLGRYGIINVGSEVKVGDILVGKITPKAEDELSPEEKLLDAILGNKAKNTKDSSLRVPHGSEGIVRKIDILDATKGNKLEDGVKKVIKIYIAKKRKLKAGDKMSGRHGNKGVVSIILPQEDMPYLKDGTPVDIMLNPLGVPSRMNIGQVFEIHLGMAAKQLGIKVSTPIFSGATFEDIQDIMKEADMDADGKFDLWDGTNGAKFDNKVAVGVMYMLKLSHMIDDKMHARSIGPYSLITQQPLRGKSQNGGQRFGEMEAWALEAYGASHILQEMVTLKSDDIHGRNELYNSIAKGKKMPLPSIPEGFWVLYYELRGLGLTLGFLDENDKKVEIDNSL